MHRYILTKSINSFTRNQRLVKDLEENDRHLDHKQYQPNVLFQAIHLSNVRPYSQEHRLLLDVFHDVQLFKEVVWLLNKLIRKK